TLAEFELRRESHIPKRGVLCFECLMIVGYQSVRRARISEGKFAGRIDITEKYIGYRLSALIARIVSHQNCAGLINNTVNNSGPSLYQHQHHRFSCGFDCFGKSQLRLTES